jgi:molecular chaperone GrpE
MPADTRRAMIAWLDGVRLARMRLLDVLKVYHVTPIPTLGQAFDPHRHVAVATDTSGQAPDGTILSEDRRGYTTPDKVLRFAEVVVARLK